MLLQICAKVARLARQASSLISFQQRALNRFTEYAQQFSQSDKSISQNSPNRKNLCQLQLYNSFTRKKQAVQINGEPVIVGQHLSSELSCNIATAYICGPTVYDDSHLGHAITYLRFDIMRRVLQSYCNLNLVTIMNITDVDDKIIARSQQEGSHISYLDISNRYLQSFWQDLHSLDILSPDLYVRVSDQMPTICAYIRKLESSSFAYINSVTGDICIDLSKLRDYPRSDSEHRSVNTMTGNDKEAGKRHSSDFVLWKKAKPGEPYWTYENKECNTRIDGRPGWHVECSAISTNALGNHIDFHFGGMDLFFPHHVNESACCRLHAHNVNFLNNGPAMHEWVGNWIHFGQLIFKSHKMSKSLGNTVKIRDYMQQHSKHLLRLICLQHPYRRDIYYDEDSLMKNTLTIEMKIKQFLSLLKQELSRRARTDLNASQPCTSVQERLRNCRARIECAIADEMNLPIVLESLLDLMNELRPLLQKLSLIDLICLSRLVHIHFESFGLNFECPQSAQLTDSSFSSIEKLIDFRADLRKIALEQLKVNKSDTICKQILNRCDAIRESVKKDQLFIVDK